MSRFSPLPLRTPISSRSFLQSAELQGATVSAQSKYQISLDLHAPYMMDTAATLERQLTRNTTLTVNYLNARGVHQFFTADINQPLLGEWNPLTNSCVIPLTFCRPIASYNGDIFQYESGGVFKQNQVTTNVVVRISNRVSLNGYYSLNYASSSSNGNLMNSYDPSEDYGRAGFAVRNRVFFGGNVILKHGFSLSPFLTAASGSPYNITAGTNLFGVSGQSNARPTFATNPSDNPKYLVMTPYGLLNTNPTITSTGPTEQFIPTNLGTGPANFSLNLRVSKSFGFGRPREAAANTVNRQGGGPGGPGSGLGGPGGPGGGGRGGGGGARGGGGFGGGGGRGGGGGGAASGRRYTLTLSANARNLLNIVNPGVPNGVVTAKNFGTSTTLAGGGFSGTAYNRQISLQATFSF